MKVVDYTYEGEDSHIFFKIMNIWLNFIILTDSPRSSETRSVRLKAATRRGSDTSMLQYAPLPSSDQLSNKYVGTKVDLPQPGAPLITMARFDPIKSIIFCLK